MLGHSHYAECILLPGGAYLNPGYWFADRTFGYLDQHRLGLSRWTDGTAEPLTSLSLADTHAS